MFSVLFSARVNVLTSEHAPQVPHWLYMAAAQVRPAGSPPATRLIRGEGLWLERRGWSSNPGLAAGSLAGRDNGGASRICLATRRDKPAVAMALIPPYQCR